MSERSVENEPIPSFEYAPSLPKPARYRRPPMTRPAIPDQRGGVKA